MSSNQFLAIIFCIQLWSTNEAWVGVVAFIGFVVFGFFGMIDALKYDRTLAAKP